MKTAEYKLPTGVHPLLGPTETGRTPDTKDKDGNVIKGKPIYGYKLVKMREAETLDEFAAGLVEQDDPSKHVLSLAQAQWDIIEQRKVREYAASEEVRQMLEGEIAETKGLTEDERIDYAMAAIQELADTLVYGSRGTPTGGVNAQAKKALARDKKAAELAEVDPELAALKAQYEAKLAALGVGV